MRYEIREAESTGIVSVNIVKIDDDGTEVFIPVNDSNSDYQTYLQWTEENSTEAQVVE